ncbi:MAG: hypothetical protein AAGA08_01045 [Pseudomonadota bacterium]
MNRIGFSDLTSDEALSVCIYREWSKAEERQDDFDDAVASTFFADAAGEALPNMIAVFSVIAESGGCRNDALLSDEEEHLLDALSKPFPSLYPSSSEAPRFRIRPASNIPRSGKDALRQKIDAAQARIALGI